MKKKIRRGLMVFFLAVFAFSAWQLYRENRAYQTGSDTYSDLTQYASFGETVPDTKPEVPDATAGTACIEDAAWPRIDFDALGEINPDIVGWLYIEGTEINYPVVQGTDNDYYLHHLFDGTYNRAGCLFLDAYSEPDFCGRNSIIYGHHLKNGAMFTDLMEYKRQEFYEEHPRALLITPTGRYTIQFFSGYVSDTSSAAWDLEFSDGTYGQWLSELAGKSCFAAQVTPTTDDRVVTLSTCTYEFDDARFVLHGIIHESDCP